MAENGTGNKIKSYLKNYLKYLTRLKFRDSLAYHSYKFNYFMDNPYTNRRIIIKSDKDVLEPTVNAEDCKLDKGQVNKIAELLADQWPPKSDMFEFILGFEDIGGDLKESVLRKIFLLAKAHSIDVEKYKIRSNILSIISAYKKESEDVTHLVDTSK